MKYKKCDICGTEISVCNYSRHYNSHFKKVKPIYHVDHDDLFCKFCGKECKNKNSLAQHEIRCKENPNKINTSVNGFNLTGRCAWNKGLTKETDERVKKYSESISRSTKGKSRCPLSEEHKHSISVSRKKFLTENPDKVPYIINHSSKMSYPESYFLDIFEKEDINLNYHLQVSKYELDFYNIDYKLDVEIDGEQHFLDERIYRSDRDRDKFLQDNGWKVFRIRWSEYKKLSFDEKNKILLEIRKYLV